MEWKLFTDDVAYVSTAEFHSDRERAPHLEQPDHRPRLEVAAELVRAACRTIVTKFPTVVDLGCGDGGLLSLLNDDAYITAVGFDFQPSNAAGWKERQVHAELRNFVEQWASIPYANVYVMTECLEHLTDPHKAVARVLKRGAHIIASSPFTETGEEHDGLHAWAWDHAGYADMLATAGFTVVEHRSVGRYQVIWGRP